LLLTLISQNRLLTNKKPNNLNQGDSSIRIFVVYKIITPLSSMIGIKSMTNTHFWYHFKNNLVIKTTGKLEFLMKIRNVSR